MCHFQSYFITYASPSTQHEESSGLEHSPFTIFAITKNEQATLEPRMEDNEWSETLAPYVFIHLICTFFYSFIANKLHKAHSFKLYHQVQLVCIFKYIFLKQHFCNTCLL